MSSASRLHVLSGGLLVALVGFASSTAIVVKGLEAVGAGPAEITSGLAAVSIAMGLVGAGLSLSTRMPISVAWTTPGMALLATTGAVPGGFPAVVGAFLLTGAAIVVAGLWEPLGRLVAAIPKPVANAMLAGVLMKLCLAPFVALARLPMAAAVVLATWLVLFRFARLWAAPGAAAVALGFILFTGDGGRVDLTLPMPVLVMPVFEPQALISIALPLFLVTMASQNIPGYAVLATYGYHPRFRPLLLTTGLASVLTAPLGAPTTNLAAITAALCAGPDADPDPARRWRVAVAAGAIYVVFGLFAAVLVGLVTRTSPLLVEAAAGLALLGALGASLTGALAVEKERVPALLTFLTAASGLSVAGIGPAFWALVVGLLVHLFLSVGRKPG
ncbi:MAG: benzoate/H(+) symporter BenE family transporter [Siculibacillus sp.]|nr:benzoate/H(+) symporter BenE family transporter [Siculibacillus sp.]